jgi:hypothetical protein
VTGSGGWLACLLSAPYGVAGRQAGRLAAERPIWGCRQAGWPLSAPYWLRLVLAAQRPYWLAGWQAGWLTLIYDCRTGSDASDPIRSLPFGPVWGCRQAGRLAGSTGVASVE